MSHDSNSSPMSLDPSPTINQSKINSNNIHNYNNVGELRSITELSSKYWHIFSSYPSFNAFQSKVMPDVLYSDKSVVISAPTGSGKTVLFELAIIKLLNKIDELKYNGNFIIVYLAPIKALCTERFQDWNYKFSPMGLKCQEVTGDTETSDLLQVSQYNIVLTTPEKWDSLTRKWRDNQQIIQLVKLFLIDEVHLLNDERRGPILEAVVSRMKTVQETCQCSNTKLDLPISIRFIAVSATIPNIEDVACWIGEFNSPAVSFKLGEEFRPVKLKKIVLGYNYPQKSSQFRFEMMLSYRLKEILLKYAEGKPAMIFCSTRKGVFQTSEVVSQQLTFHFSAEQEERLSWCITRIKENKIKNYILAGVGCHHAGMDKEDRCIIEDLFRSGFLPVLVTTSTLAMGVNLPAHLVVIKSTQQYVGGTYQDYSESQVLQMIGRAGRPQFDISATAIIMTKNSKLEQYEKLIEGKDKLESYLHRHLIEHLNSEVVLSTITEKAVAINWIRSTFLYVRAMRNPRHYGFQDELTKLGIENKLQDMCLRELNALASINLLHMEILDVRPTETGRLMAQYYMRFETMKIFSRITGTENLSEMLAVVSNCHEFSDYQLRTSDKKTLNALNKSQNGIRFPLKGPIKTRDMKINCLIQASFSCLPIQDNSLHQEAIRIIRIGERITKCLAKYLSLQHHYNSILNATLLAKCFRCCLWENSFHVSRQLERIGPVLSALLVASGKTSFEIIAKSNPRDLERIMNRPPPMGNRVQEAAKHLPQYSIELNITKDQSSGCQVVEIKVTLINNGEIKYRSTAGPNHWITLLAGDSNNKLWLCERLKDDFLISGAYSRSLKIPNLSSPEEIYTNLVSDQWVGLDINVCIKLMQNNIMSQHVQENLQKYAQNKITQTRKHIQTVTKIKQKSPSVTCQLQNITNGILQDLGTKRLRSNAISTPSKVNLDRFLYTPLKYKKLPPSWDEFVEAKSDNIMNISSSSLPNDMRISNPYSVAKSHMNQNSQQITCNNEDLPLTSVESSVIKVSKTPFLIHSSISKPDSKILFPKNTEQGSQSNSYNTDQERQNICTSKESVKCIPLSNTIHNISAASSPKLQETQSPDSTNKLFVHLVSKINENQNFESDNCNSSDITDFTDTESQILKRTFTNTNHNKSHLCNNLMGTPNIQIQNTNDKCNTRKKGPYFNAMPYLNNTLLNNSIENNTLESNKSIKLKQYCPIFSKTCAPSKEKDSEPSPCTVMPNKTILTTHHGINVNQTEKNGNSKIRTEFKDIEDCSKINAMPHQSGTLPSNHESVHTRSNGYSEQSSSFRNKKDMEFALQKFNIQDHHGGYPVMKAQLQVNFNLGTEQFLTKFSEDDITDDKFVDNKRIYEHHIENTEFLKSNKYRYQFRNKRKYCEDETDPVTLLLYNTPNNHKASYNNLKQTVQDKVIQQLISTGDCKKNIQLPTCHDFTSETSSRISMSKDDQTMLYGLINHEVNTESSRKKSFSENVYPILQQEMTFSAQNVEYDTNQVTNTNSFAYEKNHSFTSDYQFNPVINHEVNPIQDLSNYTCKIKKNNVFLNCLEEIQSSTSQTNSICHNDQIFRCITNSHLGELYKPLSQQKPAAATMSYNLEYYNSQSTIFGTEICSQELFTQDSRNDKDCVSPLVLSNNTSPISPLTSACSNKITLLMLPEHK